MVAPSILFLGLIAAVVAEPIPQGSAAPSAAPTAAPSAFPTSYDTAGLASSESALIAQESAFASIFSGVPTLPASVASVLETAVPESVLTASDYACQLRTATPDWYKDLPADVKSALSSYETAAASWLSAHSAQLASLESSITAGQSMPAYQTPVACTGGAVGGSTATATGGGQASAGGPSATGTGSSTGSGSAGSTSKSSAGAASTGAVTLGAAGVVGMLGLLAVL